MGGDYFIEESGYGKLCHLLKKEKRTLKICQPIMKNILLHNQQQENHKHCKKGMKEAVNDLRERKSQRRSHLN